MLSEHLFSNYFLYVFLKFYYTITVNVAQIDSHFHTAKCFFSINVNFMLSFFYYLYLSNYIELVINSRRFVVGVM